MNAQAEAEIAGKEVEGKGYILSVASANVEGNRHRQYNAAEGDLLYEYDDAKKIKHDRKNPTPIRQ